jgi:hypothetical protein
VGTDAQVLRSLCSCLVAYNDLINSRSPATHRHAVRRR